MTATRTKPEIDKAVADDSSSCILPLFQIVIFLIVLRVAAGMATTLEKYLGVGIVIVFIYLLYRNSSKEKRAKAKWRATCTITWLAVLDRHSSPGKARQDADGIVHSSKPFRYLELEMNADQKIVAPNENVVRVDLSRSMYNSLLDRKTVCIYYQPDAPLAFFIAEEF